MTIKLSHPPSISHENARMRNGHGHALPSGVSAPPPCTCGLSWGPLAVISAVCLLMEVFFWNRCLPLVLWLWHWSTVVCKRQYITAPGSPLCLSLHSWKVSVFPGRWSMCNTCPALVISEGPRACFVVHVSKGGWGAWEFPAGSVTTQCQNPLCHVTLLCHIFLNSGFWGTF